MASLSFTISSVPLLCQSHTLLSTLCMARPDNKWVGRIQIPIQGPPLLMRFSEKLAEISLWKSCQKQKKIEIVSLKTQKITFSRALSICLSICRSLLRGTSATQMGMNAENKDHANHPFILTTNLSNHPFVPKTNLWNETFIHDGLVKLTSNTWYLSYMVCETTHWV